MPDIHPTAIVDRDAVVADDVVIGPWSIVGPGVTLGRGSVLGPHTRIEGPATIGERNRFFGQCSIGTEPQDLKFKGEHTELRIGNDNVFREFVTVNRGTHGGGGVTEIGSESFFMAYSHVAHDCHVGSGVIFANGGTLAGHVEIGDYVTVGAYSAIHQFCRVGDHAFIGGFTVATQDVLPFIKTVGARGVKTYGVNTIGLERKSFPKETIEALQKAYRTLTRSKLGLDEALRKIDSEIGPLCPEVRYLVEFIRSSKRGVIR